MALHLCIKTLVTYKIYTFLTRGYFYFVQNVMADILIPNRLIQIHFLDIYRKNMNPYPLIFLKSTWSVMFKTLIFIFSTVFNDNIDIDCTIYGHSKLPISKKHCRNLLRIVFHDNCIFYQNFIKLFYSMTCCHSNVHIIKFIPRYSCEHLIF